MKYGWKCFGNQKGLFTGIQFVGHSETIKQ